MTNDIFEQLSQRSSDEETAENRRIHEVADELRRRCRLYEAQFRGGEKDVNAFDREQRITEQYAKENGIWLSMAVIQKIKILST